MDDTTDEDKETGDETADDLDHTLARGVEGEEDGVEVPVAADAGSVVDGPLDLEEKLTHEGSELGLGVGAGEALEAAAGGLGGVDQGDDFGDFLLDESDLGSACGAGDAGAGGVDGQGVLVAGGLESGHGSPHVSRTGDGSSASERA